MVRTSLTGDVFGAIADPVRRHLLERLATGELSVTELTEGTGLTTAAVSLHLKTLVTAGLARRRISGRYRYYRLDPAPLRAVADWASALENFWNERADRLKGLAESSDEPRD